MSKTTLVIVLLAIIATGMYMNSIGFTDSKPALKITITTGLDENETVKATNIEFEQTTVPFFYKRVDSVTQFPEISTIARRNNMMSEPISFWASTPRPDDIGVYTIMMTFRDGKEPKTNDSLILPLKFTDVTGYLVYKTTAFYGWE